MNSVTLWILLASTAASISAFVAYWAGVGVAERRHKAREHQLLNDLDDSVATIKRLCRDRHPVGKGSHLTLVQGGAS